MNKPDHYRQHALESLRLANDTHESSTKAVLIDMAQAWIRLAEQARRKRGLDLAHEAPAPRPLPAAS